LARQDVRNGYQDPAVVSLHYFFRLLTAAVRPESLLSAECSHDPYDYHIDLSFRKRFSGSGNDTRQNPDPQHSKNVSIPPPIDAAAL